MISLEYQGPNETASCWLILRGCKSKDYQMHFNLFRGTLLSNWPDLCDSHCVMT